MYCWDVSTQEKDALSIVNAISTCLSFIGSLATIIFFLRSREKKQKMNQLIVFLAFADLGATIFILVGQFAAKLYGEQPMFLCTAIRAGLQFFLVSSFFWTSCIAIHMYRAINQKPQYKYLYIGFHVVSWGVPFALAVAEAFFDIIVRAHDAPWCNLKGEYEWGLWLGPMILSLLLNFVLFLMVLYSIRRKQSTSIQKRVEAVAIKRLSLYLLVFVLCWIWNVIDRIITEIKPGCEVLPIWVLQDFFSPLQGFLNFIVYGLSGTMVKRTFISYNEYSRRESEQPLRTPVNGHL